MNDKFPFPMVNPSLDGAISDFPPRPGDSVPGNPGVPGYVAPGLIGRMTFGGLRPNDNVIGTCSKCRGPVAVPAFGSGVPPVPTCRQCGAKKKSPHGPVIEME